MTDDIEAYREAIEWVRSVHPGALEHHVVVSMTWEEWNTLRALLGMPRQEYCDARKIGG